MSETPNSTPFGDSSRKCFNVQVTARCEVRKRKEIQQNVFHVFQRTNTNTVEREASRRFQALTDSLGGEPFTVNKKKVSC